MKQKIKPGTFLDVTIQKIVPQGVGLGFSDDWTVFVPLTAVGDKVKVKIKQIKSRTAFAEIVEITEPSNDRREPPCIHFGRCGGCDFQHLQYDAQLKAKLDILQDCLTRIGKIGYAGKIEIIPSPREFGYRSRTQWQADKKSRKIGYFKRQSHEIINVETCPVLTSELQKTLTALHENLQWGDVLSDKFKIEAVNAEGKISVYSPEMTEPTEEISFSLGDNRYFYDARSFFQGNLLLIEKLVGAALHNACGKLALDLYCGVGLFTLPLAKSFDEVIGIEESKKAIETAQKNLEYSRFENVQVHAEKVGRWLAQNQVSADFILLDPPRSGTEKETIREILKIRPQEISYISCEPAFLARDLRIMCENLYEIQSITALDLFPQTHHVETVVRLKLK